MAGWSASETGLQARLMPLCHAGQVPVCPRLYGIKYSQRDIDNEQHQYQRRSDDSAAVAHLKPTRSLTETQNRISTGLRVADASDNAAYWSIATTMRSDNAALSTVQDALGLGGSHGRRRLHRR